ncbi:F/Y rich C-terminus-domain-containing protein [Fennellomyces sp. T-0311]|nr:F/Y rich C-terminus-domain-containing protein [Fennellomyces sp. T-0311]
MALSVADTLNTELDMTTRMTDTSEVTEEKYQLLKRRLKEITEKNEVLASDLSRAKKRLRRLAKEKNILLERICRYDRSRALDDSASTVSDTVEQHSPVNTDLSPIPSTPWHHYPPQPAAPPPPPPAPAPAPLLYEPTVPPSPPLPQPSASPSSSSSSSSPVRPRVEVMLQDGRMVPSSRPKRMRRGPVEPKMRRVQPLEKDPVSGKYKLPARVGILTVHSLGRVVPLPTYHNDRYIWPPGFKVSRTYLSMVNPNANTVYTCSVEENGEQGPRFRVVADDCPDQPIIANSATGVWTAIVKRANEIRHRDHSNSASGPDYYGFTHATIAKMIQDLPGTENCINYVWQKFGVMHQRTAAGVAAAAQKKLTNLEIMGSANKRPPPLQEREEFHVMEPPDDQVKTEDVTVIQVQPDQP